MWESPKALKKNPVHHQGFLFLEKNVGILHIWESSTCSRGRKRKRKRREGPSFPGAKGKQSGRGLFFFPFPKFLLHASVSGLRFSMATPPNKHPLSLSLLYSSLFSFHASAVSSDIPFFYRLSGDKKFYWSVLYSFSRIYVCTYASGRTHICCIYTNTAYITNIFPPASCSCFS